MSLDLYLEVTKPVEIYHGNLTHNLAPMAREAGLYFALWRPDELNPPAEKAGDLIPLLSAGLARLEMRPEYFQTFNPKNGWGTYEGLLRVTREYLAMCRANTEAAVKVDR